MLEDRNGRGLAQERIWPSCGFRMAVFEKSMHLVGSVLRTSAGCQVLLRTPAERFGFLPIGGTSYSALLGTKLRGKPRSKTNSAGRNVWWQAGTAVFGLALKRQKYHFLLPRWTFADYVAAFSPGPGRYSGAVRGL